MSDPIGPGDWVECINITPGPGTRWANGDEPTLGKIYKVRRLWLNPFGVASIDFTSKQRHPLTKLELGFDAGYNVNRFRPVHRPGKSTLIQDLLTMVPEGVKA